MALRGLEGKVAVVTGAASGIGAATTRRLHDEGCRLILVDLADDAVHGLAEELKTDCIAVTGDAGDPHVGAAWEAAGIDRWGGVDFLHNCAGAAMARRPFGEWSQVDFDAALRANLQPAFACTSRAVRHFLAMKRPGAIVNTAALAGLYGYRGVVGYVAAKHAMIGLTRTAAADHAADGIRVNAICPGLILTPMTEGVLKEPSSRAEALSVQPMRRAGVASEIASLVAWLLSDEASFVSGSVLVADGAFSAALR